MAGVVQHTHGETPARARHVALVVLATATLALLLLGGRSVAPPAALAQASCPAQPAGLSPPGPGPTRFTMLVRINTQGNVDTWSNFNETTGGLGPRIRPQDIFVINTRFAGSGSFPPTTPSVAEGLANNLRAAFPCNRIIALNGMSFDSSAAGFAYTLVGNPNVFALMTDFEKMDWDAGRATDPGRPGSTDNFEKAFPIIRGWNSSLVNTLLAAGGAGERSGLVPQDNTSWDWGQVAQNLDKKNKRLGATHLGPLSVQTQDSCANGGPSGFGARAKALRLQYKFRTIVKMVKVKGEKKKRKVTTRRKLKPQSRPLMENLSLQISFSDTPTPSSSMAILKTSAATAAACVPAGLKQGGGAFFFFASDDSMRLLFQQPQVYSLRPPAATSSKGTGGIGAPG